MALSVRGILARVAQYRPDLDPGRVLFAIQESAREVLRYAPLAREIQAPVAVLSGVNQMAVTPTTGDLLRVIEVRFAPLPQTSTYLGTWDASANNPVLASGGKSGGSPVSPYGFYLCTTAGTTLIDGLSTWDKGDIVYSGGGVWKQWTLENYTTSVEINKPSTDLTFNHPQAMQGYPTRWSQEGGNIRFYPSFKGDMPVEVTLSWTPTGEFDSIPVPDLAQDAIEAGALAFLLELPGDGHNERLAEEKRRRFYAEKNNLRCIAEMGYGGDFFIQAPNFSGTSQRVSPYNSVTWYM
jgi:hypothetical protein